MNNPNERLVMPTKRDKTYVQFFFTGEDDPFICGADGNVSMLDEIEKDYLEDFNVNEDVVFKAAGDYLFTAHYEQPQIGEYGRIELAGYWDLELVAFEPLEA